MAEPRKKLPQVVTPKGTFRFPKLSEPDYGNDKFPKPDGEYSVQLVLQKGSEEFKALMAKLETLHKEALAEASEKFDDLPVAARKTFEKKKIAGPQANPIYTELYDKETEEPTGEVFFKATMKASGKFKKGPKQGQKWERSPIIFDAKGRRMANVPAIWSGTVGKVSVEVSSYFIPGTAAAGIKLNLNGVQIIDLVSSGGRSAESMGFNAEDGYEHDDSMMEESAPAAAPTQDADEGNF